MLNEKMIEKLTAKGFNRWTKGKYDRLYINAKELGLVCEYYKTGNIKSAEIGTHGVSNSEAYRMKSAKTYIDIETGEVVSDNRWLKEAAEEILEAVKSEIEAEGKAAEKAAEAEETEVEMIVEVREYKVGSGNFENLVSTNLEAAKSEINEILKTYESVGYWDVRVYKKTKYSIPMVNAIGELFESFARMDENRHWTRFSEDFVNRTTRTDNGQKFYTVKKVEDAEHFINVAMKYAG